MTIRYLAGQNLVLNDADILTITVNTLGTLGKGVALAFKQSQPWSVCAPYAQACRRRELRAGDCQLYPLPSGRQWAALATKADWRAPSRMEWVEAGLERLAYLASSVGARRIALPPPGCSNGQLSWPDVHPVVLRTLRNFDLDIHASPPRKTR